MSYIFNPTQQTTFEQKVQELQSDIRRFTKACLSDWPSPIDYTNLIDAQYALQDLKDRKADIMQKGLVFGR